MLKRYRNTVGDILRIVDGFVMVAAWLLSYWLRFYLAPFALTKGLPPFAGLRSALAARGRAVDGGLHVRCASISRAACSGVRTRSG